MRRFWCTKYAATVTGTTLVTFVLFWTLQHPGVDEGRTAGLPRPGDGPGHARSGTTRSGTFRRRKLTQGGLASSGPGWTVLPGNVTVHEGRERVPFNVSFKVAAEDACRDLDAGRRPRLLVLVASRSDHARQRQAIRDTWGLRALQRAHNFRVVFLVGEGGATVEEERYRYGDLVQTDLPESFRNLGHKSVAGLYWSRDFCPAADFVAKADDDILVHVPNLLGALPGPSDGSGPLLMCHENRMRKILREGPVRAADVPLSYLKYVVPQDELPGVYYPPYCSGMAYAFSRSVRDRLLEASLATPVFFIEDVYLTGFCRYKAGVELTSHPGIALRPAIEDHQAACSFGEGRITSQEVGADELRRLWAEANTRGFFCPRLLGLHTQPHESSGIQISSPPGESEASAES